MRVLFLAAHGDDETLAAGGTLLAHHAAGDEILWAVVTSPKPGGQWSAEEIGRKKWERQLVAEAYGFAHRWELDFPAALLDRVPMTRLVNRIQAVVENAAPDVVYTVSAEDWHSDHRMVMRAAEAAIRPHRTTVRRLVECETISAGRGSIGRPTLYRDITPFLDRKMEILKLYASEAGFDSLRTEEAVRAWARVRGAEVGRPAAEAFRLVWAIE